MNRKQLLMYFTGFSVYSCFVLFTATFFAAFFNGGRIIVNINHFNEGLFEAIVLVLLAVLSVPYLLYSSYCIFKND